MAIKKPPKAVEPPQVVQTTSATLQMSVTEETQTYYLNAVEVGQSFYEFAILLGKIPAKPTASQMAAIRETKILEVPATLQLLVPPALIPGMIYALNVQRKHYEATHGAKLPDFPAAPEAGVTNAH